MSPRSATVLDRTPRSTQEIQSLPRLDHADLSAFLRREGPRLSPDTLVYLIRELLSADRTRLIEPCARLLMGVTSRDGRCEGGHCEGVIRKTARAFGLDREDDHIAELRARCYARMWEAILAGRAAKPFWECRFAKALKALAIDEARRLRRERRLFHAMEDTEPPGGVDVPDETEAEDGWIRGMDAAVIRGAIRRLPPQEARVAWLKWVQGCPVAANKGGVHSITELMGISDSMVRRYARTAEARLAQDPDVRRLRGTDG